MSLPATSSGKRFSWGPGLVRTVPGSLEMQRMDSHSQDFSEKVADQLGCDRP